MIVIQNIQIYRSKLKTFMTINIEASMKNVSANLGYKSYQD